MNDTMNALPMYNQLGSTTGCEKPKVMRYETGISENNLKHWGELEAVKEFVQNTVFAKTILGDDISIEYTAGYAILKNTPHGFSKGKLLIGESDQADVEGAPGQYGEGMKVAMAVACRLGLKVAVHTTGFSVKPALEPSAIDKGIRVLVFYIEDRVDDHKEGTTFIVQCSEDILEKAKSYFAVLNGIDEELTKKNSIIDEVSNTVFVNGVKITETKSLQSYNFTNANLINRDRSTVDMNKVKTEVSRVVSHIEEVDRAAVILQEITADDTLLESQSGIEEWSANPKVWKDALNLVFGDKVAIATGGESDTKARYHKFSLISKLPSNWKYFFKTYLDVYPTNELDALTIAPTRVPVKPKGDESANLGWSKRLVKLYYGDYGTVKVATKVLDQHKNECNGCYDPKTDITWLKRDILSDKEECFKTLLHETVHRVTGATDNTPEFTKGWETACWGILMRGAK